MSNLLFLNKLKLTALFYFLDIWEKNASYSNESQKLYLVYYGKLKLLFHLKVKFEWYFYIFFIDLQTFL